MIDNTQTQLGDEDIHPSLLDILRDRELNQLVQSHSSLEEVKIEIKISQKGQELLVANRVRFNSCPCGNHTIVPCTHSVDSSGNAICS